MRTGTPLTQFIIEDQRNFPEATGRFTRLLIELTVAGKIIAREVNKAGLAEVMGITGKKNVHGEEVQKLDEFANATIIRSIEYLEILAAVASEEMEEIHIIPADQDGGEYVLVFDPLDGSSNIDVNVGIGTIFSIYRKKNNTIKTLTEDFLRKGNEQVCAGYMIYGSSTMLVYTTGRGVYGFTLDPTIGEFFLSHEDIKIPERGAIYSVNEANSPFWEPGMQGYIKSLKVAEKGKSYKARYVGSLVADFHRNLLKGGVFLYPADAATGKGKLRLLYEAAPLAFVVSQAGGLASTGRKPILDIQAQDIHETVPLVIGSKLDVEEAESFMRVV